MKLPGCSIRLTARSNRRLGEYYCLMFLEPLSDLTTERQAFFNILLELLEFDFHDFILHGLDRRLHFDEVAYAFSDQCPADR